MIFFVPSNESVLNIRLSGFMFAYQNLSFALYEGLPSQYNTYSAVNRSFSAFGWELTIYVESLWKKLGWLSFKKNKQGKLAGNAIFRKAA